MMNKYLLLVDLLELLTHSRKYVTHSSVVWKCKHTVVHVKWWLVTMANLKAFFVPANHFQLLLKSFNVSVDITYLYMLLASYYQTTCQVDWLYISLLNKLHVSIKRFTKGLVDTACHHFWIDEVVEWRNAPLQKVHFGERDHIHCNFIKINF